VLDGLHFVISRAVTLGAISLDLFAVLFGGADRTAARDCLGRFACRRDGLGLLRSATALGAATTTALLAFRPITAMSGAGRSAVSRCS
jgi:hypothetical protein